MGSNPAYSIASNNAAIKMPIPFDNVCYQYCSFFFILHNYYFLFADNPAVGEVLLVMQGFKPYGAVRIR